MCLFLLLRILYFGVSVCVLGRCGKLKDCVEETMLHSFSGVPCWERRCKVYTPDGTFLRTCANFQYGEKRTAFSTCFRYCAVALCRTGKRMNRPQSCRAWFVSVFFFVCCCITYNSFAFGNSTHAQSVAGKDIIDETRVRTEVESATVTVRPAGKNSFPRPMYGRPVTSSCGMM